MAHIKATQITSGMKVTKINKTHEKIISYIKRFFTERCDC
jgi:hypothetical protein